MGRRVMYVIALLALIAGAAWVLTTPVAAQSKQYVIQIRAVTPPDGHVLFDANCSACHGKSGKGTDAVVRPSGQPVPDLTMILVRDGSFDTPHLMAHVRYPEDPMLDFGRLLPRAYKSKAQADLAVRNLVTYVKTLQVEP